jgi:prophage maintenance system killer protein
MIRFPTQSEVSRLHDRLAAVVGGESGVSDGELLRAVLLGARISRSGSEAHAISTFRRAADLLRHIVTARPFKGLNGATGLAVALLYLERHGHEIVLAKGQAGALVEGARTGSMDAGRVAALFELRTTNRNRVGDTARSAAG